MMASIRQFYCSLVDLFTRISKGWLLQTSARVVFAAVLFSYYLKSFFSKVGEGFSGFFQIQSGAYYQIVPGAIEAAGYDPDNVSVLAKLMVLSGTYMEFLLPCLIVAGLMTRAAAVGMIGFILVQTYVDIVFHGLEPQSIGAWFDAAPDAVIADQRLLWIFVLLVLVKKGGGYLSLDTFGKQLMKR